MGSGWLLLFLGGLCCKLCLLVDVFYRTAIYPQKFHYGYILVRIQHAFQAAHGLFLYEPLVFPLFIHVSLLADQRGKGEQGGGGVAEPLEVAESTFRAV